jgi:hypothetical protein
VKTLLLMSVVLGTSLALAGPVTIDVVPTLAPNTYGSPSFSAWQANAVQALINGVSNYGDPTSPTYYQSQTWAGADDVLVTGFPSWNGMSNPGSTTGSAYANELGRRITFGLRILGDGSQQFSISQLAFSGTSDDPWNFLDFGFAAGGYTYSAAYQGLNYGADRQRGGGDDVWVTSGPNTQLVDAIFGRGSGNSGAVYCAGCTVAQQQAAIEATAAYAPYRFTGTYSLAQLDVSGSAVFQVNAVPEPASLSLMGGAILGLAIFARRRK